MKFSAVRSELSTSQLVCSAVYRAGPFALDVADRCVTRLILQLDISARTCESGSGVIISHYSVTVVNLRHTAIPLSQGLHRFYVTMRLAVTT